MIDALFSQPNYVATKKLLDVSLARQSAIASNLRNLETPNYKRLDVPATFESQLRQAVLSGNVSQVESLQPVLAEDTSAIATRMDGNTVQLETEMGKLQQNTLEHMLETQLVTSALLKLRAAISGRAN